MKYCIITFRSVTPAQRAEESLRRAGFACTLQRTPKWMEEQGCGYSLKVRCQDIQRGVAILKANGIAYRKVYWQRENGTVEEMEE
jgi:hypothetical protein